MTTPALGFTPSREPHVDWIRNLPAAASTNRPIAKGDAVAYLNGVIVPCTSGQDPGLRGYGVVLAVYTTANRPLTFNNSKIIASAGVGRVDVCFDPNQTYYVRCTASAGPSNMGKNVTLDDTTNVANSRTGISGQAVTIPASASQNDLFKVINISPFEELAGKETGGGAGNGVEVKWNFHLLHASTPGQ